MLRPKTSNQTDQCNGCTQRLEAAKRGTMAFVLHANRSNPKACCEIRQTPQRCRAGVQSIPRRQPRAAFTGGLNVQDVAKRIMVTPPACAGVMLQHQTFL